MKVLMVIPALGNVYGGPTKIVIELAESVAKLGISVDIVATNANGSTNLDVPLNQWVIENYYRLQYFTYLDLLDYKFTGSMTKWLFKNVSNYDIVHTNAIFSYPVLAAHWACQFRKVPYIATPHGMMEPWALAYKAWKKKLYFNLLEKPSLQTAKAMQMTASTEARHINTFGLKIPLVFVPNGIHSKDFEFLPSPDIFYQKFPETRNKTLIIFLGRIDPKKGLDLLAPAFAKAHRKFPDTHLIVAGPDNTGFLPTAENYFIEAGCKNAVTFTGMLTGEMKYAALAAANIYVAPSYSEGFSMSVLEGMAAGLPCVITTGCNFPEAGMANVASIVDIDVEQIANALIQLLQDSQAAKKMGDRARQFILENYTWDSVASKMVSVYQEIINDGTVKNANLRSKQ
ncbi:glycosyltransferase [Anabaena sphaerica FACHB-251]|uniref:Glycosyltransferase n=1 Tax=Anabaena sphaerica FACHB-251 TaxID=2692883 RepID=A0A926WD05_9NOST|nr:glycosyltransferase [Anabaena sphaerica]MBD2292366.1 glycosyltransferase [Anabaena sphaerica FACHB-251]